MSQQSKAAPIEAGYSLVEVVIVIAIIGIVANIAIPIYRQVRLKAEATQILGDFRVVRQAALQYYNDTGDWPRDRGAGAAPRELAPYLEGKIDWNRSNYRYDWEGWVRANGKPKRPGTGILIGFSVRSSDRALLWMIENTWGSELPKPRGRRSVTFVIEGI